MNAPTDRFQPQTMVKLPPHFDALNSPPQLLPGESLEHYRALQAAIFSDLNPRSSIEWLLAIDVAELSWEMQRYRVLRQRLFSTFRQQAIEAILRRVDLAGLPSEARASAETHIVRNALDWQIDPSAAADIEARLRAYGFDQHATNMEVYVQAREMLSLFETLLNGAQLRRLMLLKEINNLRNLKKPAYSIVLRERSSTGQV